MNPILDACLLSWPWDPWLVFDLVLTGVLYLRGWIFLHRRDSERWPVARLTAFFGGLFAIFLALASPIEPFSIFFLQVHMLQHLLLMMVAPPLLWLGAPMMPLLRGLPQAMRMHVAAPVMRSRLLRSTFERLTHPAAALAIFVATTWLWHVPQLYDLALRSSGWHYLQHLCFLVSALIFWYPVVRPYPSRPRWALWWLVAMLLLADVQNTVLSALLTFSSRVIYIHYDQVPRLGNFSALDDQAAAGVLMWVPGSIAFLVPLFVIGLRIMFGEPVKGGRGVRRASPSRAVPSVRGSADPSPSFGNAYFERRIALTVLSTPSPAVDALNVTLLGRFLKWRHARLCLQLPLLALASLVVIDGFRGPQVGAMNLAGVLPWIHWRGVLIIGLLVLGNVFCMACPFMLPRQFARWLRPASWNWPRLLRNKWGAIALLLIFLWTYEAFALWDSPWLTAWIVLAYFAAAFVVDSLFRGAAFCKYVCPIGQFNFVQSLMSPLEIKVRDPKVCEACLTKDCIRGRDSIPGCELKLHQPRKAGNMDCTFCLDCIHACPHDNIGIAGVLPGAELVRDPHRSGIGRFSERRDLAALIIVLTFGAFANAALMTGPVVAWQDRVFASFGPLAATSLMCLGLFIVLPVLAMMLAAPASRWAAGSQASILEIAVRFSYALVPIGFAMWFTHYSFHFLTSYATIVPTTQRFFGLGTPAWACSCCVPAAAWLIRLEIVILDVGLLASLYVAYRIARQASRGRSLAMLGPWALLIGVLFAIGVWIVFQPMEMRGTMGG